MERDDEDSASYVFRFWVDLAKEQELLRLLELIRQEFCRRGQSLSYEIRREPQAGQ